MQNHLGIAPTRPVCYDRAMRNVRRQAGGMGVTGAVINGLATIELLPSAPYEAAYTPGSPVIGFAFEAQSGMHAFASDRRRPFLAKPNHLSFVPVGCDLYSQSARGGEYLRIVLESADAEWYRCERRFSNIIDGKAILIAEQLRRNLIGDVPDELLIEKLVNALSERVLAILTGEYVESPRGGWMTPRRLRLSLEQIEEHLATKLSVHELALSLGLSAGFFSRAFREAVGKAPHDYIIDRRVARARSLLQSGSRGLSAVAQAAGFSSHAHMTSVFRKRLGTTPSGIRCQC
jgi:AraC family transcriptional regulator